MEKYHYIVFVFYVHRNEQIGLRILESIANVIDSKIRKNGSS